MKIDRTRKEEFQKLYLRQAEMVYRICFLYLKNRADTEDAIKEIANILKRKESTIQSQLASARKMLGKILKQEVNYE